MCALSIMGIGTLTASGAHGRVDLVMASPQACPGLQAEHAPRTPTPPPAAPHRAWLAFNSRSRRALIPTVLLWCRADAPRGGD
eukprot:CAMPEP_0185178454 /NCGR_PEP_ID=MMETSP1139-20130426/31216_1 /TAXON_ID=298111 /ORGANISM="Pavlova sp., Strain CCMP459" /LENGTH=82 /DNA_ID=CAMNT_0027744273 /DNA_START=80 /DNA_END=325 /DNA_ORIENTATION=-